MYTETLVASVEELVDAAIYLEEQRAQGQYAEHAIERLREARAVVREQIRVPHGRAAHPLIEATSQYLDAETAAAEAGCGDPSGIDSNHLRQLRHAVAEKLRSHAGATRNTDRQGNNDDDNKPLPLGRRIMVAIDGSKPSRWAVTFGAQLADALAARVMFVHVVEPITVVNAELAHATLELDAERRRQGRQLLERVTSAVPRDVEAESSMREGSAAKEIVTAAREWEADLIVMGTRGRGRLAQFLLGSTAEAVIRNARCPVLTVGHQPERTNSLRAPLPPAGATVG